MKVLVTHTFTRTLEVEVQTDSEQVAQTMALAIASGIQTADWDEQLDPIAQTAVVIGN